MCQLTDCFGVVYLKDQISMLLPSNLPYAQPVHFVQSSKMLIGGRLNQSMNSCVHMILIWHFEVIGCGKTLCNEK